MIGLVGIIGLLVLLRPTLFKPFLSPALASARLIGVAFTLAVLGCSPAAIPPTGAWPSHSWTVISIHGQDTVPEARPTMPFAPKARSTGAAATQYTGKFPTEGDRIAFGQVSSTLMGCDGQRAQVVGPVPEGA